MTYIKCGGKYLRDYGKGRTETIEQAHNFTPDEAHALIELHHEYTPVGGGLTPQHLYGKNPPTISPGEGMVWVKYKTTWLAAEKQALFVGTRKALDAVVEQLTIA